MSQRDRTRGAERHNPDAVVPPAEKSWQRHLHIRDMLEQIREARGRKRVPKAPDRPR